MNDINLERYQDDEIDLKELFNTIMKKKKFIIIFTSIITILAIIWAITRTPIYEVKSNLQIGFIEEDLIADPNTIVKATRLIFNVEDKKILKEGEKFISEVSDISLNKKIENFIKIKTQAISNDEALKKNKEVVKYIEDKFKNKIDKYVVDVNDKIDNIKMLLEAVDNNQSKSLKRDIERIKQQEIPKINDKIKFFKNIDLKSLNKKIKLHEERIKKYRNIINSFSKNKTNNTAVLAIVSMKILEYQNLMLISQTKIEDLKVNVGNINKKIIPKLLILKENFIKDDLRKLNYQLISLKDKKIMFHQEINALKLNLLKDNIQNSMVIGDYIIRDYPIKPKKLLIVIVSFITGLILSIFLAFFLEFINKKEDK